MEGDPKPTRAEEPEPENGQTATRKINYGREPVWPRFGRKRLGKSVVKANRLEASNHTDALNTAGLDGWEIVGMSITSQSFLQFFLKRPISD